MEARLLGPLGSRLELAFVRDVAHHSFTLIRQHIPQHGPPPPHISNRRSMKAFIAGDFAGLRGMSALAMIEARRLTEEHGMTPITGIRACVFDAYGTVFDFASAVARCPDIPDDKRGALTTLWRDKQLQYTWLRTLQGRYADFRQVTGDALDFALDSLGLAAPALRERLMRLYLSLETFPEVPQTLRKLREAGFTTAILSNGSPDMLDAAVRGAGLQDLFDAVLSADAVQAFKTHPSVYEYGLRALGVEAREVCFQSSNAWDAYAASAFGMRVVWCNRYGQRRERLPGAPDHEVRSLAELPALLTV